MFNGGSSGVHLEERRDSRNDGGGVSRFLGQKEPPDLVFRFQIYGAPFTAEARGSVGDLLHR